MWVQFHKWVYGQNESKWLTETQLRGRHSWPPTARSSEFPPIGPILPSPKARPQQSASLEESRWVSSLPIPCLSACYMFCWGGYGFGCWILPTFGCSQEWLSMCQPHWEQSTESTLQLLSQCLPPVWRMRLFDGVCEERGAGARWNQRQILGGIELTNVDWSGWCDIYIYIHMFDVLCFFLQGI